MSNKNSLNLLKPTENQEQLIHSIINNDVTLCSGPGGAGKSLFAIRTAINQLKQANIEQIIISRNIVNVGKTIGTLPGDADEKCEPYFDYVHEYLQMFLQEKYRKAIHDESVRLIPVELMRGHTYNNAICILDECFPGSSKVWTSEGIKTFNYLNAFKDSVIESGLKVWSYNEKTKQNEWKRILNVWDRGEKAISKILTKDNGGIKATKNHKFFTYNRGWVELQNLLPGDLLKTEYQDRKRGRTLLNADQEQIILGMQLGDGSIQNIGNSSYRCSNIHSIKQSDYLHWKAERLDVKNIEYVEKNGYAQKPAERYKTKTFYSSYDIKNLTECIQRIDERGLAISWMDDGYFHKSGYGVWWCCAMNKAARDLLLDKLNSLGYSCAPDSIIKNNKTYHTIRFRVGGFKKFQEKIAKFMCPSMAYKISEEYHDQIGTYEWDKTIQTCTVVDSLEIDYDYQKVYDIEVEDNHNFYVCNKYSKKLILAHNCQSVSPLQVKTFLSRMGKNSKCVLLGDLRQKDSPNYEESGLEICMNTLGHLPFVGVVRLGYEDVKRNDKIGQILRVLNEAGY